MGFIINLRKTILCAGTILLLALFGVSFFLIKLWIPAAVCLAFMLVYLFIALQNISTIYLNEQYIERRLLGLCVKRVPWEGVQEFGVAGVKVIGRPGSGTGEKYIYFSPQKMNDQERYAMCLKWPPKDILYMRFTVERIHFVQKLKNENPVLYNTGDLSF